MKVLVEALGLPFLVKKLEFRRPYHAVLAALTAQSDPLMKPWPDLILCAEALTSVIARRLKKKSGGKIKIVSLARPNGDVRAFDLVLTTAQYRLPQYRHVVELSLPLTPPVAHTSAKQSLPKITTVLVGATSPPEQLDVNGASELADQLMSYARLQKSCLQIITSPRTSPPVANELVKRISAPHKVFVWSKDQDNPYEKLLSEASDIIVTCDSVSMLGDAVATGKAVHVYRLPRRFTVAQACVEWLFKRAPQSWIFRSGLVEPSTDRWVLVERLIAKGHVRWFGKALQIPKVFDPRIDIEIAVNAIRKINSKNPHPEV